MSGPTPIVPGSTLGDLLRKSADRRSWRIIREETPEPAAANTAECIQATKVDR
jgi:hypothetical protein